MSLEAFSPEYRALFASAVISSRRIGEVDSIITRIIMHEDRYEAVEQACGTPWFVVGLIHNLECDLRFDQHLHNGDPLAHLTVNVPAHRPPGWLDLAPGDRTWEKSAGDALLFDHLNFREGWDVPMICFKFEGFNGFGYRNHSIHSPYLWSGCQHYTRGKYIADGIFNANAISEQLGSAVILKRMVERHLVALPAAAA